MVYHNSIEFLASTILSMNLVILLLAFIFIKTRVAKVFILNSLISLLIVSHFFHILLPAPLTGGISVTAICGILLYPFTFIFLLENFNSTNNNNYFYLFLQLILIITFLLISPQKTIIILAFYLMFFNIHSLFVIKKIRKNFSQKLFYFLHILFSFIMLIVIKEKHINALLLSGPLFLIPVFLLILRNYREKFFYLLKQMSNTSELNRKLTHQITRLKQSNEQSRKIIADKDTELYQLSRHASLAEVTTGIAHELAQPLTGIKGIAQNMVDDLNFDDFDKLQAVSELQKISSLVDKSSSIIDHIRNFSKKTNLSIRILDINSAILEAIDLVQYQLKKNDIELICKLDDSLPPMYGDTISIEQLIVNIILNSKDAIIEKMSHDDSHEGVITIETGVIENSIILTISDNGIGIPKDIIPKIWSPFFTSKKRNYGTGVGLSISSKIIKEHNGQVFLSSNSQGTTFAIHFKIAA